MDWGNFVFNSGSDFKVSSFRVKIFWILQHYPIGSFIVTLINTLVAVILSFIQDILYFIKTLVFVDRILIPELNYCFQVCFINGFHDEITC